MFLLHQLVVVVAIVAIAVGVVVSVLPPLVVPVPRRKQRHSDLAARILQLTMTLRRIGSLSNPRLLVHYRRLCWVVVVVAVLRGPPLGCDDHCHHDPPPRP